MKAIAIIELPDDAFEYEAWGDGKWEIDDEGCIRYLEDGNAWCHYKDIDIDGIELKPMPEKMDVEKIRNLYGDEQATCAIGYNACLDEITGETE